MVEKKTGNAVDENAVTFDDVSGSDDVVKILPNNGSLIYVLLRISCSRASPYHIVREMSRHQIWLNKVCSVLRYHLLGQDVFKDPAS